MSRIQARECVLKLVYEYLYLKEFNQTTLDSVIEDATDLNDDNILYIKKTYAGIIQNYDEILSIISSNMERYTIEQLNKVDLSILIEAIYNISILKSLEVKVEINEAIELAKKYSTDNSYKFINGVLAKIVNNG